MAIEMETKIEDKPANDRTAAASVALAPNRYNPLINNNKVLYLCQKTIIK